MDGREIAMRYLKSDFIVDFAASLPIPQACPTLIISSYNFILFSFKQFV